MKRAQVMGVNYAVTHASAATKFEAGATVYCRETMTPEGIALGEVLTLAECYHDGTDNPLCLVRTSNGRKVYMYAKFLTTGHLFDD